MKSAGDEMIRLGVAIGFVCGGCNRREADVVQNAHGDAKPPPILSHKKKGGEKNTHLFRSNVGLLLQG